MRAAPFFLASLLTVCHAFAQDTGDDTPAGHSQHGQPFSEGPRQRAQIMGMTGEIDFPVTTKSRDAQRFFNQGMGQLHGFWYFEAERSFRQAAALDPSCAMAYWGMGMANADNEERVPRFAHEAWKRRQGISERERLYVEALARLHGADNDKVAANEPAADKKSKASEKASKPGSAKRYARFIEDLETICFKYPQDIEAKALLANQIWLDSRDRGINIVSRQANQALLDQVFAVEPLHPAHHYQIHLWDTVELAERALRSASLSGQSAPGIAHMWHMGGHIFARLDRHEDAAWQQDASARVDHAHMMRDWVLPDQITNYSHNNEWLIRSLRNVGRVNEAVDLAKNMIELPRHPKYNHLEKPSASTTYGRKRLIETLVDFELWETLLELGPTQFLEPTPVCFEETRRQFALAQAWIATGQKDEAKKIRTKLGEMLAAERRKRAESADTAEEEALEKDSKDDAVHEAMKVAMRPHASKIRDLKRKIRWLDGLLTYANEDYEDAFDILEKAEFPPLQLSRMYLEAGRPKQAITSARKAAQRKKGIALPHANLAYVLDRTGSSKEACEVFNELREISAHFDLEAPPFARLKPLAESLGHSHDWRKPVPPREDIGTRPDLDSLGPFRWSPVEAPAWTLKDSHGKEHSLASYSGRPVLLVFFLGFDCLHCVEQLDALRPKLDALKELGISLVTVGTSTKEQVRTSIADNPEAFTFPILPDPKLEVFKRYRAHDDFENMALHGTFLIDGRGRIRWQDISYDPFMDIDFLLAESRRLLGLGEAPGAAKVNNAPAPAPERSGQ